MNNLEVIKAYQKQLWGNHDINAIEQNFAKDALIHSAIESTQGTEKMKTLIQKWLNAFPDLTVTWDDFIVEGDKVVSRWHTTGTHKNEFLNHEASNKTIHYPGVTIYRLLDGKVVEYWSFINIDHILNQIKN